VKAAIACEVDDSDPRIWRVLSDSGIKRGKGLRQGMPLSPILSNFLLRDFDQAFTAAHSDFVRYADDLIILACTREECAAAEALTRVELSKLGLVPTITGAGVMIQALDENDPLRDRDRDHADGWGTGSA